MRTSPSLHRSTRRTLAAWAAGVLLALLSAYLAMPALGQHSHPTRRPTSVTEERNWMMSGHFARVRTVSPSGGDFAEPDAACTYVATQTRSSTATWLVMIYPGNYTTDCAGAPVALPTFTTLVRLVNLGPVLTGTSALLGTCQVLTGAGSPEGAVAAPVCSLYLRTDGGTGTSLCVKETGTTTSSGWVCK